jgi:hypothetical protein
VIILMVVGKPTLTTAPIVVSAIDATYAKNAMCCRKRFERH